jgi:hypothetical protein
MGKGEIMIDAKIAVKRAKEKADELLGQKFSSLEELEKESVRGRDAWAITLGFPRNSNPMQLPSVDPANAIVKLALLPPQPVEYKRFYIDVETGELLAMRLREFASQ